MPVLLACYEAERGRVVGGKTTTTNKDDEQVKGNGEEAGRKLEDTR